MANRICVERNYDNAPLIKAWLASTDSIYSSDIGALVQKSSNKYVMAVGGTTAATAKYAGYIDYLRPGTTHTSGGSTNWFMLRKFSPDIEVEVEYSTLYSTVHPATSDIGSFVGGSTAATDLGGRLDLGTLVHDAASSSGAGQAWLQITGFSTKRRRVYGLPYRNSSNIAW